MSSSPSRSRSNTMSATGCACVEPLDVARAGEMDAALEALEPGGPPLRVERDDFAVDEQRRRRSVRASASSARDDRGELRRLFVPEPRPECDTGAPPFSRGWHVDQRADAVVLGLVDQARGRSAAARRAWPASGGRRPGRRAIQRHDGRDMVRAQVLVAS